MNVRHLLMLAVAVLLIVPPAFAADPPAPPETPPAAADAPRAETQAAPAERLAPFIKVIRESDNPRLVMTAYSRALAVDRGSVELHESYMRRMLKFGLPQIARYAALELTRLDPGHAMAWGVLGYMHGREGKLAEAFVETVRAVETKREDKSVLHNAGQLVAWNDLDADAPKAPDAVRRILDGLREELARNETFRAAYQKVKDAYADRGQATAELAKLIAVAEAEAQATQRLAIEVDHQLRDLNDEIDYRNRLIDSLWREYRYGYIGTYGRDIYGRDIFVPRDTRYLRDEVLARIRAEEREIEALRLRAAKVRREGDVVLVELNRKQATLKDLRDRYQKALAGVDRVFRWDPPAVDGVVTAEVDQIPAGPPPKPGDLPSDPETEAAQRLELAKLYLRHNMSDRALAILDEIAAKYAKTKAAEQAKVLLGALKP